jgi:membrane-associated protease RseP (regulator of RpoE activity)
MSQIVYEILFFAAIVGVILVHEAGHFTAAKAFKMKVEEFFVGFGPRLWSTRRGETEYGVKLVPAGGYVRIAGMNPFQPPPTEDAGRTYADKPPWQRATVILAGPVTHFLIAILTLTVVFVFFGTPRYAPFPEIQQVVKTLDGQTSPAFAAGLRPGDLITSVDGKTTKTSAAVQAVTEDSVGRPLAVAYLRDGRHLSTTVTPVAVTVGGKQIGRMGVEIGGKVIGYDRTNPFTGLARGVTLTWDISKAVLARLGDVFGPAGIRRIGDLLGGAPRKTTDVGSIVGTAQLAGEAAKAHQWSDLLLLFATVNVFVGILNLIPVLPFDGGHLAIAIWEKVTKRRVDTRRLVPVAALVFAFLMLVSVSVLYLDIVNPIPNPFH